MIRQSIAVLILSALLSTTAQAQTRALRDDALLAGMRAYPADVRTALLAAAREPQILKSVAEQLAKEGKLELPSDLSPGLKSAYGMLSANPDLILFAADQADALGRVAQLYERAPEAIETRWGDLGRSYDQARRDAARVWQKMLESEPLLLRDYINAVDQFSRQRREQNRDFAVVQVTDRAYYYACPPNDALLAQLDSQTISPELKTLIERWWHRYGDGALDTEAQRSGRSPIRVSESGAVIDWSATERQAMWRPMNESVAHPLGLAPVMLQPLEDQPRDARLAFAIAENMRLWAPAVAANEPAADAAPDVAPPADAMRDQALPALSPEQYAANVDTYGVDDYAGGVTAAPYAGYTTYSAYSGGLLDGDIYGAYPYAYSYGVPAFSIYSTFGYGGFCARPRCFGSRYYYDYGAYPLYGDPYGIWGPAFGCGTYYRPHHNSVSIRGSIGGVRIGSSGSRNVIHLDADRLGSSSRAPVINRAPRQFTGGGAQAAPTRNPTVTRTPVSNSRGPSNPAPRVAPAPAPRAAPSAPRPSNPGRTQRSQSVERASLPPHYAAPAPASHSFRAPSGGSSHGAAAPRMQSSAGHSKPVHDRKP